MGNYDEKGNRIAPYKEDSTKGSSLIKPLKYKCDVLTQAWIDSRILATLDNWLESIGYRPRSMSDVARKPLEILIEHLISQGVVKMVEETNTARESLQTKYRVKLNANGRGGKNALHNKILTNERIELGEVISSRNKAIDVNRPIILKENTDRINALVEHYNRNYNTTEVQDKEDAMKLWNKTMTPKKLTIEECEEKEREIAEKDRIEAEKMKNLTMEEMMKFAVPSEE